jgi:hypothetical protein
MSNRIKFVFLDADLEDATATEAIKQVASVLAGNKVVESSNVLAAPSLPERNGAVEAGGPVKRKIAEKRSVPAPIGVASAGDGKADGEKNRVLALISKGPPRTSGELIECLHCNPAVVYQAVSYYKSRGDIVLQESDDDGKKRWALA